MIIRTDFDGDDNDELKDAQNRLYGWAVGWIVNQAWNFYRYAEEVRGTPEDEKLPGLEWLPKLNASAFDHRVVQETHDILAAGYRQVHKLGEKHWEDRGDPKALEAGWEVCVRQEVQRWMADPFIVRAIVMATQYANKSEGLAAERTLARYLREMYGLMPPAAATDQPYGAEAEEDCNVEEEVPDEDDVPCTLEDLAEYEATQEEPEWESDEDDDEEESEEDEDGEDNGDGDDRCDDNGDDDEPRLEEASQSARCDALTSALGDASDSELLAAIDAGPDSLAALVRDGYLATAQAWDEGHLHPDSQDAADRSVLLERRARRAKRFYEGLSEGRKAVVVEAAGLVGIRDVDDWVESLFLA
jgi:hypothetical protein